MLPVQEHDVEVFGIREFAQLVEFFLGIHALAGGDLGHQAVTVTWEALQGYAEHPVHLAIRLGSLEEANAAVVGIAHQSRKPVLSQVALYLAAEASGAKGEARHLDSGFSQRYPICRGLRRREQREATGGGKRGGGDSGF